MRRLNSIRKRIGRSGIFKFSRPEFADRNSSLRAQRSNLVFYDGIATHPSGARNDIVHTLVILISAVLCLANLSYASPPERIISLAPQITEMLYAIGLEEKIVGVTDYCDYPPEAKRKPKIGGMSNPSLEAVYTLKPDIVVMTTDGNPKEFETRLRSLGIKTYVFEARVMEELPEGLRALGRTLGAEEKAGSLASSIESRLKEYKSRKRPASHRVVFVVWPEPLMVAGPGTAIDDAISLLGRKNVAGKALSNYPRYSVEELLRSKPDYIIFGGGHMEMKKLSVKLLERLKNTPAVEKGKVFYMDDKLYRLGPRIMDGVRELEEILER